MRVRDALRGAGHAVDEVSVGATPTELARRPESFEGLTEIRPGNDPASHSIAPPRIS